MIKTTTQPIHNKTRWLTEIIFKVKDIKFSVMAYGESPEISKNNAKHYQLNIEYIK